MSSVFFPEERLPLYVPADAVPPLFTNPEERCPRRSMVTRVFRYHIQNGKEIKHKKTHFTKVEVG